MESLVVFARQPVAGEVKTRLAESLGDDAAVALYRGFLEDTVETCRRWRQQTVGADPNRRLVLAASPDAKDPFLSKLAEHGGMQVAEQGHGSLGDRLARIMDAEFSRGARAVCVIGSDSPTVPRSHLDHAFRALHFEPAVFGPSFDGGYWLVGAQRPAPDLFTGVPWSSSRTLDESLKQLRKRGVAAHLLPYWYDVDTIEDVHRLTTQIIAKRSSASELTAPAAFESTYQALLSCNLIDDADIEASQTLASHTATNGVSADGGHR